MVFPFNLGRSGNFAAKFKVLVKPVEIFVDESFETPSFVLCFLVACYWFKLVRFEAKKVV